MTCNKIAYSSALDARNDLKAINSGGSSKLKSKLNPYHCPKCDFWHLTSFSKKKSKSITKEQR